MAKDRIYINNDFRDLIEKLTAKGFLGFNDCVTNKEIFLIAMSLGLENPKKVTGKRFGYFLLKDLKNEDKALINTILLGQSINNNEIDKNSNLELNYDYSESCAEAGFEELHILYEECSSEDLFIKRLINKLDNLYEEYKIGEFKIE